VKTFHSAVIRSFSGGGGLCISQSVTDKMLNAYLMVMIISTFKEGEEGQKTSLEAACCIGRQPDSKVWVLNSNIQISADGQLISVHDQKFVWNTDIIIALRNLDNGETLSSFLANQDLQHTIKVPLSAAPLKIALGLLKKMMGQTLYQVYLPWLLCHSIAILNTFKQNLESAL